MINTYVKDRGLQPFSTPRCRLLYINFILVGYQMIIYKATFPNEKSYIGLTSYNLEKRKRKHFMESFNKNQKSYNVLFHKAIRKYGWENVKWEIIEDKIINRDILIERESFNILKYDTFMPNGYNMTLGGDGGDTYKNNPNYKNIIIKLKKRSAGKNNPMHGKVGKHHPKFGIKHTKIQRENMGKARSKYTCVFKNIKNGNFYTVNNVHKFAREQYNEKDHHFYDLIRGKRNRYKDFILVSYINRKEK